MSENSETVHTISFVPAVSALEICCVEIHFVFLKARVDSSCLELTTKSNCVSLPLMIFAYNLHAKIMTKEHVYFYICHVFANLRCTLPEP